MPRKLPNMNALRAFEAAARLMSFSRAADELCVSQGAIGWHIKRLEAYLGVPLFKRLTRAVELTEYGCEYLPVARDAFDRIAQATAKMERLSQSRLLVVDVLPTFAMRWLIPRLTDFNMANPEIEVHMLTSIRPIDFQNSEVDIAIRVGVPPNGRSEDGPRINLEMASDWTGVHVEKLMPDILVPVCNPSLLDPADMPRTPRDLLKHVLLHNATRENAWRDWFHAAGFEPNLGSSGPAFGHFFMSMQAAMEGRGIALVPRVLAEQDLSAGRLVPALNCPVESVGGYYFLCREAQLKSPAIRRFRDWILLEANHENG